MENIWKENIDTFLKLANKHKVRMLLVGGGAVNFYGFQRHSADVDFWIDTQKDNLNRLLEVFNEMGYEITDFPESVKEQKQNISVKFSPADLDLELITKFSVNKSFDQAYKDSTVVTIEGSKLMKWNVLSVDDLITSKIKSGRTKDLLDIEELKKIMENPQK
ncbi:nucleotidyltransferase [uncultured Draconibacterium sp.]|uniref:nucleotidyltransferase n=1 Tax=uncultured Draconibacterium sp. TaxID=1573823 RepID=UPI0029C89187|nr:nucleotidyltransferase [uncultured Draconibacterium sp.]